MASGHASQTGGVAKTAGLQRNRPTTPSDYVVDPAQPHCPHPLPPHTSPTHCPHTLLPPLEFPPAKPHPVRSRRPTPNGLHPTRPPAVPLRRDRGLHAPVPFQPLASDEVAALEALEDAGLEAQRAGAFEQLPALDPAELGALARAEADAEGLEAQRGGDIHLTDREVQIVLWTAVLIAVVFIVA